MKLASKSCAFKKEILVGAAKPILKPVAYERAWQLGLGIFLHLLILQREKSISPGAGLSLTPKAEMEKIFPSQWVSFLEFCDGALWKFPSKQEGQKSKLPREGRGLTDSVK